LYETKSLYTKTALAAICEYFDNRSTKKIESKEIPDELKIIRSCFVTLKTEKGKLRGCIGTIKPKYKNLYTEIIRNAVSSAFFDNRFDPVSAEELEKITVSVEVLSKPEEIFTTDSLNPKKFGLIIQDKSYTRGVLLPNIKGIDTIEEQIRIVKRKAGISNHKTHGLRYYRFTTEKFR